MTIDKAILLMEELKRLFNPGFESDYLFALALSLEALKGLKADREVCPADRFYRLPGETAD